MSTFLEVEGKMGPIPQPTSSQYRSPQPDTNPKARNDKGTEKRKRVVPTKGFRANTVSKPSEAATHPPQDNFQGPSQYQTSSVRRNR